MPDKLYVGPAPHLHYPELTSKVVWSVFLALIPAGVAGVVIFGLSALKIIIVSVVSCVLSEWFLQRLMHKKSTVFDGSAALTGLLLAYNLSSAVPLWLPVLGSFFAISICKAAFGGIGKNIFNPALAARAFLLASWPKYMTTFVKPLSGVDAITQATPLMALKEAQGAGFSQLGLNYWDLLIGRRGGCIGEVCLIALLAGALYLLWKKYIWWQTPVSFILTVGVLSWVFGAKGSFSGDFLFSILSGGLMLGAFFMATDYVTSPLSKSGQLIFGIGCGLITFVIRKYGGYPEGVSYSILVMNAFVPLIDRHIRPRIYGTT